MNRIWTPGITTLIGVCLSITCGWSRAAQPEQAPAAGNLTGARDVISPRTTLPVVVDGHLEEPAWAAAAEIGRPRTLGGMAPTAGDHADARLIHDAEALYLAIACKGLPARWPARLGRDDRGVYAHDRIEVFVDPSPDDDAYHQLVVDCAGNVRDTLLHADPALSDPAAWNGAWQAAVARTDQGWNVELTIPFAAFGVSVPKPGDLWRLKVCRDGGREGPLSWPPNPTGSFHSRDADGALYFEAMNLLQNPDFEQGEPASAANLPHWYPALTSPEVDHALQGTVEVIPGGGVTPASRAVRITKLSSALWWPQFWSQGYDLEAGVVYEFSVMVRGDLPQVNLRANCIVQGQTVKMHRTVDVPAQWQRLSYVFCTPIGTTETRVGMSAPRGIAGEVFYDRAVLRRSLTPVKASDRAVPLSYDPDPDPIQGLEAFMQRHGQKPYDLFQSDDELLTHRLIFRDRQFGTWVWMLDDSPTVDHTGTASVWSAWNADGSTIYIGGRRMLNGERRGGWFFNSDFSRLRPAQGGRPAVWAPEDPDIYYASINPATGITRNNWRTGEVKTIATWEPLRWKASTMRLYGLTRDRKYLFVDIPNRGIFVPFTPDDANPIPQVRLYDGRPVGPEGVSVGNNTHSVVYDHPKYGDLVALRTGMLVDRETGERTYVVAPLCGNTNYLRAFHENRVTYPKGEEWHAYGIPWFAEGVRLPVGLSMDELYQLWLSLPHVTHGHESPSPDWRYIASDGTTHITCVRTGQWRAVRLSPNGTNYHLNWGRHPRFFIGWVRGWHFGSYLRPEKANTVFQVFFDGTAQPIVDTKHRLNGYYSGGDFSMLSPDDTKIHYGSSMTGRFRNYIAVMARPRPPRELTWESEDGGVTLSWVPSPYSRETRGYLVYRGDSSGGPYAPRTPQPVTGTSWRDTTVVPGRFYYYVVSSLEHCGLESGYSTEAARAGVGLPADADAPVVVYAEAEDVLRDLPTDALPGLAAGVDRHKASDWYYLYRHPGSEKGEGTVSVTAPVAGRYHLWTRVRSTGAKQGAWDFSIAGQTVSAMSSAPEWTWARAAGAPLELPAECLALRLSTSSASACLDMLCFTTDPGFEPRGPRPEDRTPPGAPVDLQIENIRGRANQLRWQQPPDADVAHYQVYASTEAGFQPGQATLIGSPTTAAFIDWGLRAGTRYHYAVTAVDRRGNESAPIRASCVTPPASAPPFAMELAFAEADLTGPFETSEAGGLRAARYVVAEDPVANRVNWHIEIPREGTYYFWLRYLFRGNGRRGEGVSQNVRISVNGKTVTTLGGGRVDLNVPDNLIAKDHELATRLWTWAWPGSANLTGVSLPAGEVELVLDKLAPGVRYDVLVITDEPSFCPDDGRLRQR